MAGLYFREEELREEKNYQFLTKENSNNQPKADQPSAGTSSSYSFQELDLEKLFKNQKFKKQEKLKSKKLISELFLSQQNITQFPLKLVWKFQELKSPYPAQIAFSVPKKLFKKAVERNVIKRQMREVYRLNRYPLYKYLKESGQQASFMLIFVGKKKYIYTELETKFNELVTRFINSNENH